MDNLTINGLKMLRLNIVIRKLQYINIIVL